MSVDPPAESRRLKQRLKSRFTFLADQEGALLDELGIRHRGGRNDGADIAYPTAVLVDADGVVRWIFQSSSYRERARAEEIFAAIAELQQRVPAGESRAPAAGAAAEAARAAVDRVVADYVGLYASPTLDRWRELFHPSLAVASPNPDGTILVRDLDRFFEAQRRYLASGRAISERLEKVRIEMGSRIARVSADFVLVEDGAEQVGKLGLHLVEGADGWRIVAVVFAYDAA